VETQAGRYCAIARLPGLAYPAKLPTRVAILFLRPMKGSVPLAVEPVRVQSFRASESVVGCENYESQAT